MTERRHPGDGEYIFPSTDRESRRLEAQARLYGGVGVLEPFLSGDPREVLEVGCGTGHFTRHVAARTPAASVVGLDIDAARISLARSLASGENLNYEQGDLGALPFDDDRFDIVYCRFVLVHDRDPLAGIAEMTRVARPGGRVVAYDMVHDGVWFSPAKPAFDRFLSATMAAMRDGGAEPNQGLHLPVAMQRAGLAEVRALVIPHHTMSVDPQFEAYRENWRATVASLAESPDIHYEEGLAAAALEELEPGPEPQFLVEITVLASGKKAA